MGLSLVRNFDRIAKPLQDKLPPPIKVAGRYGLKGITRSGARKVRCAAHLMQERFRRQNLTFATVTVPDLPIEHLAILHGQWGKAVELYRLGLTRLLKRQGLPGEIISVTEIQEKRHDRTGIPVLHVHSLFVGRFPYGGWVVSPKAHDKVWENAVAAVIGSVSVSFKSAANLQQVKASASGYLGKYMTKAGAVVKSCIEQGYASWMPKQWWNMTRSLKQWVDRETMDIPHFAGFLLDAASEVSTRIWQFVKHITLDIGDAQPYWLATYGRLNPILAKELRAYNP